MAKYAYHRKDANHDFSGSNNPNWRDAGRHICGRCHREYKNYNKARKFCSRACYVEASVDRLRALAAGQRKPLGRCTQCGEPAKRGLRRCGNCWPPARPRLQRCLNCGAEGKYRGRPDVTYCQQCPDEPMPCMRSTCSECGIDVLGYKRKYCDRCWRQVMGRRRGIPRKTDANQAEIVEALRQAGCCVYDSSGTGGGFPDLIVWAPLIKRTLLLEVKNPLAKGKLNKLQQKWHANWRGHVAVVSSINEALAEAGVPSR